VSAKETLPAFDEAVQFHGHVCPGLAIGYRVAVSAMQLLEVDRPHDEEVVAVVENDTCAVDAVQVVTGCTFGKGNLVFKDYGKGGFSFFSRDKKKGFRIRYRRFPRLSDAERARMEELREKMRSGPPGSEALQQEYGKLREKLIQSILSCKEEDLLDWTPLNGEPPQPARIHPSIRCARCGEEVMETRIREVGGESLCIPCEAEARRANTKP
jgi:formylmethanofuran dehydrogenase subunit E